MAWQEGDERTENLSFSFGHVPAQPFQRNSVHALSFLNLNYHVPWPLNIVIDPSSVAIYNKVFGLLMLLKRSSWSLHRCFIDLKVHSLHRCSTASLPMADSPQDDFRRFRENTFALSNLRQIQVFRHEMQHFVDVSSAYFSHEVWTSLALTCCDPWQGA